MSLLEFSIMALFGLGWVVSIMVIAYLSNTRKIPSWAIDVWILIAIALLGIFLGIKLGADLPAIIGVTAIEVLIGVPIILITRRWRLKRLSRKTSD
ncbi:MAG TPA: hypothetical protein G4N94_07425 [Caldilineae bacterium]|nr:hypothetical protein [Caldilineae bacterium]